MTLTRHAELVSASYKTKAGEFRKIGTATIFFIDRETFSVYSYTIKQEKIVAVPIFLRGEAMSEVPLFDTIQIGEEMLPVEKKVTQEKINKYAEASGDYNPLHIDPEFAKNTLFKGTIAHGLLSVAYISEMMTKKFGKGWIAGGEMDVNFLGPVRPGDRITVRGKVIEKKEDEGEKRVICEVYCENQKGERIIIGKASAKC